MEQLYFRRVAHRRGLLGRSVVRYEVRQADQPPVEMTLAGLDERLEARRFPADFWAAVHAADRAHDTGDDSWFNRVGLRVSEPPPVSADDG